LAFALCVAGALTPRVALADEASQGNVAAARKHFEKARAYYGQGAYRDAITELEAAHALDPNAKDLVFNLGVVHEKLADIDEALKWFRLYTTMDLIPQERERADAYIRRLEGAKKELEEKQATPPPASEPAQPNAEPNPQPSARPSRSSTPTMPPEPAPAPARRAALAGRVDALTISAASVSAAGLLFGVVMGAKAIADRPPDNSVTTYDELRSRVDRAHEEAILADIGFGVALVAGAATAYLYFGRRTTPAPGTGSATVSAVGWPSGGSLLVQGRF
jgi:tetratricopeptide (TPR) repeat protein